MFCCIYYTAKLSVENWNGLLNNRTCAVKYRLIKSESPNLQVHSCWWLSSIQFSVCCIIQEKRNYYWELHSTNPIFQKSIFLINIIYIFGRQWLIFLFIGILPKTSIYMKNWPSTRHKKKVNFKILLIFIICQNTYGPLIFTDLLVTILQVWEHPTYLSYMTVQYTVHCSVHCTVHSTVKQTVLRGPNILLI